MLSGLHPEVRRRVQLALDFARSQRVPVTVTSTFRSLGQQRKLYAAFQAGRSQFPANPPGQSGHNYGLAWDSVVPEAYIGWWGRVREAVGFRVPANDWIHAEVPNWQRLI